MLLYDVKNQNNNTVNAINNNFQLFYIKRKNICFKICDSCIFIIYTSFVYLFINIFMTYP